MEINSDPTGRYKPPKMMSTAERRAKEHRKRFIKLGAGTLMILGGIISISESGLAAISRDQNSMIDKMEKYNTKEHSL